MSSNKFLANIPQLHSIILGENEVVDDIGM